MFKKQLKFATSTNEPKVQSEPEFNTSGYLSDRHTFQVALQKASDMHVCEAFFGRTGFLNEILATVKTSKLLRSTVFQCPRIASCDVMTVFSTLDYAKPAPCTSFPSKCIPNSQDYKSAQTLQPLMALKPGLVLFC